VTQGQGYKIEKAGEMKSDCFDEIKMTETISVVKEIARDHLK
jgi:hypothetical protein